MRRIIGFVLLLSSGLAVLARSANGQATPSSDEARSCFGFSFGPWTPPLDWHGSGHAGSPASVSYPLAPGSREWAAAPFSPSMKGTLMLFPSWWPAGVSVTLPERALAVGDTGEGRATALVANGTTPSTAAVRAWRIRCGAPSGDGTTASIAATSLAPTLDSRALVGTWRGTSTCLARRAPCGSDSVVYRIAAAGESSDSVSLAQSTIGARGERRNGALLCHYDAMSAILTCDAPEGTLRLAVRRTELGGRLTRRDGVDLRYVHVRRVPLTQGGRRPAP
jgi:hypothetical protein